MSRQLLVLSLLIVVAGCSSGTPEPTQAEMPNVAHARGGFDMRFGILEMQDGAPHRVSQETMIIPRKIGVDGFGFGLEIIPPDTVEHEYQLVHYFPQPAEAAGAGDETGMRQIKSQPYSRQGPSLNALSFDEGDLLGQYRT